MVLDRIRESSVRPGGTGSQVFFQQRRAITGTTLHVFPLDSVSDRFHIMRDIPGLYGTTFPEDAALPFPGPTC